MFRTEQASHRLAVVLGRRLMALLLSLLAPFNVKADRFDIISFEAPPGWIRKEQSDGLVFESRQAGTDSFCLMSVGRGYPATASLAEELDRAWAAVLEGQTFAGDPQTLAPVDIGNDITLARRMAPVQKAKGVYITTLNLLRGGDRLVSVLATVSDRQALDRCGHAQGDFLAGMKLDMTMPLRQPAAPVHFKRDGNYRIDGAVLETGTYRVDGQRILRSSVDWAGGDKDEWRAFKPPE